MKLVKKTADYSIYQRRDNRYAVQDGDKKAVNGDDKVRILVEEGLVTVPVARVEEAPVEEVPAEEAAETESADGGAAAEEAPVAEDAPVTEEDAAKE
jgi:hypothetical protein